MPSFVFVPNPRLEADIARDRSVRAAMLEAAEAAAEWARDHVPVDTGELQGSIHAEATDEGARVVAGTDHWIFPEFGTSEMAPSPYLRPSIDGVGLHR